jgi:hypothetical protein
MLGIFVVRRRLFDDVVRTNMKSVKIQSPLQVRMQTWRHFSNGRNPEVHLYPTKLSK